MDGDDSSGTDDQVDDLSDDDSSTGTGGESDPASGDGGQETTLDGSDHGTDQTGESPVVGPVSSPPTNEDYGEYVEDPEGTLGLASVTLEVTGAEFEPGATGIEREAFRFDIDGDRFTVTGRVHSAFKCDTFDFERVIVAGRDAIIGIVVQQTDTPDCHDLSYYWGHDIEVAGRFTGGRPDRLRIPVRTEQDQFIEETQL